MLLQNQVERNFLVVSENDSVGRVRELLAILEPIHVLVRNEAGFYHFERQHLQSVLTAEPRERAFGEIGVMKDREILPTIPGLLHADLAPDRCVVVDGEVVLGVFIVPEERPVLLLGRFLDNTRTERYLPTTRDEPPPPTIEQGTAKFFFKRSNRVSSTDRFIKMGKPPALPGRQ